MKLQYHDLRFFYLEFYADFYIKVLFEKTNSDFFCIFKYLLGSILI